MGVPQIGTDFFPPKKQQLKCNCFLHVFELNKYHLGNLNRILVISEETVINP